MAMSILPLLDQALTELETLEKRLESGHISDARHWPSLSLSVRKLASTSVELVNMPETRNRANRAQMISFCARMKTIALIFHETISTREMRGVPTFPTPGSGKIARSGKPPSTGRLTAASINASKETEALLLPEFKQLVSQLSDNNPNLIEFEWTHSAKLGPQGTNAIVEPLNWRNTSLRVLKLSNQQLGDLGMAYVSKSLKTNRTIEYLDVSGNSLTAKGVECLVDALLVTQPARSVLRFLDLSHNLIDFAGCGHIARMITNVDSVTSLLLNNNLLNDVGLTTIANALSLNCSITRLDLQQNPASQTAMVGPIFSHVLETSNYTLVRLDLGGARLSEGDETKIRAHLDRNVALLDERMASQEHASPKENAFKRMGTGPESARLHVFSADVLTPSAILRLVVTPLGANITSLIITDCGITKLPPQLCLLGTSLETLDVRRNKLISLPLEVRAFFRLKRLLLAHNLLQHLPPQLTHLSSLTSISLHGNPLQWIPQDVLSHAELDDFPPADTRLFKFLTQAANTDTKDDSLFGKLMILGHVHSGKSSLCQILDATFGAEVGNSSGAATSSKDPSGSGSSDSSATDSPSSSPSPLLSASKDSSSTFTSPPRRPITSKRPVSGMVWTQQMPRYISTEGVCTRNIMIEGSKYADAKDSTELPVVPEAVAITKRANFTVFEAGGSQIYSTAHSIFFRPDLLYLVTVDLTRLGPETSKETIYELKTTLQTIQTLVGNTTTGAPHIAIVGTFEDLLTPAALAEAIMLLRVHFDAQVLEILPISNKSSRGLSILRDRVLFWSFKSNLLASPRLSSIATINHVVRSYSTVRPFISRAELEQICRVYGIDQPQDPTSTSASSSVIGGLSSIQLKPSDPTALYSAQMKVDESILILESLGSVWTFPNDPQLQCYAFIDLQFISNVFSDIMAAADADGYIYRSHVPPLLWMDCRKNASMKSLFDWCRLFGLALDCGTSHYIIPSLLNALPQVSVYNAAWPPMERIDGISSRPHMPPTAHSATASSVTALSAARAGASSPTISPYATMQRSPSGSSISSPPNTIQAVTTAPGSLRLTPAIEKTSRSFHREMSQVAHAEWPVLMRGIATDFVPSLIFSHLLIAVFSLPGIQRCAWWRNGFIVRRDTAFIKVELTQPASSTSTSSGSDPLNSLSSAIASPSSQWAPSSSTESTQPSDPSESTDSAASTIPDSPQPSMNTTGASGSVQNQCKILVAARNDSTFVLSKALLEEVCGTMEQLLRRWYPQFEYHWVVPYTHPWVADDEVVPITLEKARVAISKGPTRTPTTVASLTVREELLLPELVDHSQFYTLTPTLNSGALVAYTPGPNISNSLLFPQSSTLDAMTTMLDFSATPTPNQAVPSETPSVDLPKWFKSSSDGSLVRFRDVSDHALPSMALQLSVLRNERIATLHSVVLQPPGIAVYAPKTGTLNGVLEATYNDAPLPWAARFRIAVDIVLALRYLHTQVPVVALQGLDAHNVLLNENYADPKALGPVARVDLSAMNDQQWLQSVYSPRPYTPSVQQIVTQTSAQATIKLSPHASDIYSLGVLLLQLWRNEPAVEFLAARAPDHYLPPVPFYSVESTGLLAYEQLIAACVCEDPTMRPTIEQVITKLIAIAAHLELSNTLKLLSLHEPIRRWRKIKQLQVGSNTDIGFSITTLCKSTTLSITKPGVASSSAVGNRFQTLDETVVWAGGVDGVLYGIPFPMSTTINSSNGTGASGNASSSSTSSTGGASSNLAPSVSGSVLLNSSKGSQTSSASSAVLQALHWNSFSTSVLDNASVQYRLPTFGPETRNTKRRILTTETTHRHIWCLLNHVTASVLDPSRLAIVAHVEVGPCISITSHEDTIYLGATNGLLQAYDGTTCKRLRHRAVAQHSITAIAANSRYVWIAVSEAHGSNAQLICLDAQSLVEELRFTHPTEETITALSLTPLISTDSATTSHVLWTAGYCGEIHTYKINTTFDSADASVNVSYTSLSTFKATHKSRILGFSWNGDFLYSCSSDSIAAWKPDGSALSSHLAVPSADLASFTVMEKSSVITGHRNGTVTIWTSL